MANGASLREQAYDHILRRLTSGELAAGSLISEPSLAKELNMSRTPVREAIRQLALEGFVEQVPRYGTIVRVPDRRELAELFDIREAMESYAVAKAAQCITAADLDLLRRLCREMRAIADELGHSGMAALDEPRLRRFLAVDMAFHMVLLRASGNRRMMKSVAGWRVFMRIFSYRRQAHDLRVVTGAHHYHRRILEAVERHDSDAAHALMSEHIRVSKEEALQCFDGGQADARAVPLGLPEDLWNELDHIELALGAQVAEDHQKEVS